jgi:hypothetical protein
MITNEDKIDIIKHRLDTLEFIMNSFIDHAEEFIDKYSLEDKLADCNLKKNTLLDALEEIGGTWQPTLTNQG